MIESLRMLEPLLWFVGFLAMHAGAVSVLQWFANTYGENTYIALTAIRRQGRIAIAYLYLSGLAAGYTIANDLGLVGLTEAVKALWREPYGVVALCYGPLVIAKIVEAWNLYGLHQQWRIATAQEQLRAGHRDPIPPEAVRAAQPVQLIEAQPVQQLAPQDSSFDFDPARFKQ